MKINNLAAALLISWIHLCLGQSPEIRTNYYNAPFIDGAPDEEITFNTGDPVELTCVATFAITWATSDPLSGEIISDLQVTHHVKNSTHVAILSMDTISVYDVKYYYCIKEQSLTLAEIDADLKKEYELFRAAKVYIFVKDDEEPIVPVLNPTINVKQFDPFVIPCRPSSKDVEVELHRLDESQPIPKMNSYDLKEGYTSRFRLIEDSDHYVCRKKGDPNAPDLTFEIRVLQSYNELEARTEFISTPVVTSPTKGIGLLGDKLTIECSVEIKQGVHYDIRFLHKRVAIKNEFRYSLSSLTSSTSPHDPAKSIGRRSLTISSLGSDDSGVYKCEVQDHNGHINENIIEVKILSHSESILKVSTPQGEQIYVNENGKLNIVFDYESFPEATYEILFNGERAHSDTIWTSYKTERDIRVEANGVTIENAGNYTVILSNGQKNASTSVFVYVNSKPLVELSPNETYVKYGSKTFLICKVVGYPKANIEWAYTKCTARDWQSCIQGKSENSINDTDTLREINHTQEDSNAFAQVDRFGSMFKVGGIAKCTAENEHGLDSQRAYIMVGDLDKKFMIWQENSELLVSEGDPLVLHCGAIIYTYEDSLEWYFNGQPISRDSHQVITDSFTDYSYRSTLTFNATKLTDSGMYECRARLVNSRHEEYMNKHVEIHIPESPSIADTNLHQENMVKLGESIEFYCNLSGIPKPTIEWYKNDELLNAENMYDISFTEHSMRIPAVLSEHEGNYRCVGTNKVDTAAQAGQLIITNKPKIKNLITYITVVLSLILVLVIATIYLCVRVRKERKKVNALKRAGLAHFEDGAIDQLNPELDLNEQADLLPYDRRFEFPREKLKLGQQLGAGAFGVVIKAVAQGIIPYEEESIVAVKMVKANTDDEIMRALISELKIMVHLGQHLNVVNLLGAVTKNIAKREMMVIVEYCKFGNLQKFLLKHRPYFVDQIDRDNDNIDPSITENEYRWSNNSVYNMRASGLNTPGVVNSKGYVMRNSANQGQNMAIGMPMDSANTEATLISRDSERPFSTGYQSEYKGPVRSVNTTDLVCWSFQVARGMEYLASRKVLHGDLATRNILLCDDNIVKICDFGLARSLYNNDNYKKNNETPLPFKWLALESLSDQVFSTYSDVWAFGIVMWEIFSLAQTPYPGIDPNRELYMKLLNGYRMEKPKYSNQQLYDIMLACWNQKPETRPLFDQLERTLGSMLQDGVKDHYVDLNEPYLQANSLYLKTTVDYLSMVGPPAGEAPPVPPDPTELQEVVPGYLNMRPKDGTAHYTPLSPFDPSQSAAADRPPEEIPMLQNSSNDAAPKPKTRKSVHSQYVNVPLEVKRAKQDMVNNPGYVSVATSE